MAEAGNRPPFSTPCFRVASSCPASHGEGVSGRAEGKEGGDSEVVYELVKEREGRRVCGLG